MKVLMPVCAIKDTNALVQIKAWLA
ncbi:hypothetical protein HaLaN_30596, partial [Haematococcus lacustris]